MPPGNQKALFGTRLARRIEKTEIRKLKTENFFITLQVRTIMNPTKNYDMMTDNDKIMAEQEKPLYIVTGSTDSMGSVITR